MYLRYIEIEGIRPIDRVRLDFGSAGRAGWHVVIGPNGSGKSTIVRAVALAMLSERDIDTSRAPVRSWLREGAQAGHIDVGVDMSGPDLPQNLGRSKPARKRLALQWRTTLSRELHTTPDQPMKRTSGPTEALPWNRLTGCFSATFGTFRRLSNGDQDRDSLFEVRPRLGAHLSALDDSVALIEAERWLQEMHVEELEAVRDLKNAIEAAAADIIREGYGRRREAGVSNPRSKADDRRQFVNFISEYFIDIQSVINQRMRLGAVAIKQNRDGFEDLTIGEETAWLDAGFEIDTLSRRIIRFINCSGFLFHKLKIIEIRKDRIILQDDQGPRLDLRQLSDGYRSIIGLGFEILRLMLATYGLDVFQRHLDDVRGVIRLSGVVVIDEVEAHLHPPWQEAIGTWLQTCFPAVQFIVTTHSPIVCRSVAHDGRVRGSVWLLPTVGEDNTDAERLVGTRLERLVFGDILEAVGTEAFGRRMGQSDAAHDKLERLALLNRKDVRGMLDPAELIEFERLKRMFPTRSPQIDA